jgi:predicted anti-sigma-YlaC factor YlaD
MTNREHERAMDIITRRGEEDLSTHDEAWLESHLALCSECAEYAKAFEQTGQLLRSFAVTASPALVVTTQARVHARAAQLREHQTKVVLIAVSFCIGVLSSTMSAWLWWKFGGWVAGRLSLPGSIVEPGMFVAWLLPAIVIAVVTLASSHPVLDRSVTLAMLGEREGDRQ